MITEINAPLWAELSGVVSVGIETEQQAETLVAYS